jgi:predicted benzoate:H+ symporter BenE
MQRTSTRAFALAVGLIVLALVTMYLVPQASAQTGPGWVTLLDGKNVVGIQFALPGTRRPENSD